MRVLFMGGHDLGATTLEYLIKNNIHIVGVVITETDNMWYRGVDGIAYKYNLELYKEKDINNYRFIENISKLNIDLIISVNFEQILKRQIINIPKRGCINIHASILPKYRGRAPINWAIINGEKETGVTVHFIEEGIDTGNIICQEIVEIKETEYVGDVLNKIINIYPKTVLKSIKLLEDKNFIGLKQDLSKGSYFGKRKAEDGKIDFEQSGEKILNLIRAVSRPYPGAFLIVEDKKIIIWKGRLDYNLLYKYEDIRVGEIVFANDKSFIKLKDSVLVIDDYSIENI